MPKFLILGAGPAGLSFACRLVQNGCNDFVILEAEDSAGGLCRSVDVDGYALDIGGGHILDVKRPEVVEFLFAFMPRDEWNYFRRDTAININNEFISHPFEANIWQLNLDSQVEYLCSIARAGSVTGRNMPEKFTDWIIWKLGEKISCDYMIPYNQKMFGEELNNLGTYWLDKLPDVSFEDTIRSCLEHRAHAKQPGHAEFYYPVEAGYGELWLRMAKYLDGKISYNQHVYSIDVGAHNVRTLEGYEFRGDVIINTIPYREFQDLCGIPEALKIAIRDLKHTSIQVEYIPRNLDTKVQWIYCPDKDLSYHRIFVRHNVLTGSKGIWTETNIDRVNAEIHGHDRNFSYVNKYAYPLNTLSKPRIMDALLEFLATHKIYGLGRWGEHMHYNSDQTVELAIKLADELS